MPDQVKDRGPHQNLWTDSSLELPDRERLGSSRKHGFSVARDSPVLSPGSRDEPQVRKQDRIRLSLYPSAPADSLRRNLTHALLLAELGPPRGVGSLDIQDLPPPITEEEQVVGHVASLATLGSPVKTKWLGNYPADTRVKVREDQPRELKATLVRDQASGRAGPVPARVAPLALEERELPHRLEPLQRYRLDFSQPDSLALPSEAKRRADLAYSRLLTRRCSSRALAVRRVRNRWKLICRSDASTLSGALRFVQAKCSGLHEHSEVT